MSKKGMGRRDFLKSSAAGLGGFIYLGSNEKGSPEKGQEKKEEKITYRILGKTGIKLPVITMGVMNTSNPALVRAALSNGMYFLDTAQVYQRGTNETMLGEVLKGRPRDSFAIATKATLPKNQTTGLYLEEATEEAFAKKIDTSLKSLGLDYVDIYHHHNVWVRESALYEPILNALVKAIEQAMGTPKGREVGLLYLREFVEEMKASGFVARGLEKSGQGDATVAPRATGQ